MFDTTTFKVDGAGGVSENDRKYWFVAIVNNHSEKKCSELIRNLGYEVYVPVQKEERVWKNGTVRQIDRILIAATVFVRCTNEERIDILRHQYAKRFMVDLTKYKENGTHPIAVVPDLQIESFRTFIEHNASSVEITPVPFKLGELVKIVRGKLKGLVGNIIRYSEGKAHMVICLGSLGCAKLNVDIESVEKI